MLGAMNIFRLRLSLTLASVLAAGAVASVEDYAKSIETWRAERVQRLTTPDGWLSLIGRHALVPGRHRVGAAAENDIRLAAGPGHLGVVTLAPDGRADIALADGVDARIDGTEDRRAELVYRGEKPTFVRFGTASFYVMPRGEQLFLRVRDSDSPRRKGFVGIDCFPIDPSWRIEARWVPFDAPREVRFGNVIGQISTVRVTGRAVFTRDGRAVELLPIEEGPDGLFFVIADQTSGVETYAAARFVYADPPKDGIVVLDFNRAQNPPCAFTPFATCPLPPDENHLPFRVTAGEMAYSGAH
jgi:uncharacterized protein